jgi:hypothetical protein
MGKTVRRQLAWRAGQEQNTTTDPFDDGAPTLGVDARVGEKAGDDAIWLLRSAMGDSLFHLNSRDAGGQGREGLAEKEERRVAVRPLAPAPPPLTRAGRCAGRGEDNPAAAVVRRRGAE